VTPAWIEPATFRFVAQKDVHLWFTSQSCQHLRRYCEHSNELLGSIKEKNYWPAEQQ